MPRFEFSEGTSNKFWQIDLSGSSFTTTFGRIGSTGQVSTKSFDSDAKALVEYNKLIAEKSKKGYRPVNGITTSTQHVTTSAPIPAVAASPKTTPVTAAPSPAEPRVAGASASPAETPVVGASASLAETPVAGASASPATTSVPAAASPAKTPVAAVAASPANAPVAGASASPAESDRATERSTDPHGLSPVAGIAASPAKTSGARVAASPTNVLLPSLVLTDAATRLANKELATIAIKPRVADNPIGEWLVNVHRPFVEHGKIDVQNGLTCGDEESQRLSRAVLKEYGSLEKMPATLDVETAAAALQLVVLTKRRDDPSDALITFWTAHSGLGFALEVFATSLWDRRGFSNSGARWLGTDGERSLESLFSNRSDRFDRALYADRTLYALWLGSSEEQRALARARAESLRQGGGLLQRSALASCVLDPTWIDADLREHAMTGARAMFSPEALLVANVPGDIATYLGHQSRVDLDFYAGPAGFDRRRFDDLLPRGYSHVKRFGVAGIDIVCTQIAQLLPSFVPEDYMGRKYGAVLRGLLEVARLARNHPPVVTAAMAVIEKTDECKLSKDEDPRPLAYDCLRNSPTLALPLVQAVKRAWAKNLLPQLERLAAGGAEDGRVDADDNDVPSAVRGAGGTFKAPDFWQPVALPRIALRDYKLLPIAHLGGLASVLKAGDREVIAELKRVADPGSLAGFAWDLFQSWLTSGAPAKEKWAFTALGLLGTDETARRITPLIRAWPGEAQHARAVAGLDVLGDIGSDVALMMLNGIAQKVKFKGLQERARDKMDEIAAKRGMTAEQLADRLVPDLDLDDDGSKTLDFGPRSFRVGFDEALGPFVVDATGTRLKDLPKPNTKDDAALGAEAMATWKAMKKDVRTLAAIQLLRLELAMGGARRWSGEEFRNFFVEHPLLTHLVRRLVWGVYGTKLAAEAGELQRTFRVAEDRSYADQSDDVCTVDDAAIVGIVHRLHLTDAAVDAWGKLFTDYELVQPFEQLGRATFRLTAAERAGTGITRFEGRVVETKKLLGLLSRGWRKGSAQDGGGIYEVYKAIRADLIVSLPFEMGLNAGGMDDADPTQKLGIIDFSPTALGWGGRRNDAIELGAIDEVVLSEVIRDVESMGEVKA